MIAANLLMLVLLGLSPGPDTSALVSQLGSTRYSDREKAASALEKLGAEAIPALREALDSHDPEVRSRAVALLDKIDSELMTRPTMIKLDFEDQSIDEVIKAINAQQVAITLALEPDNPVLTKGRRITVRESEPVPFWKAIDLICKAGGLQHNPATNMAMPGRGQVFRLFPGTSPSGPTSDSGPFRATLNSVHLHRDMSLVQGVPFAGVLPPDPQAPVPLPPQRIAVVPAAGPQPVSEQFYAQMQVMAEPRLTILQSHEIKLQEAVDEKGQSLIPPSAGRMTQQFSGYYGYGTSAFVQLQVALHRPENPGKMIKSLRGVVPVTVTARKPDPLVIPLKDDSIGKPFRSSDVILTVHQVAPDPNNQRTSIELSVRPLGTSGDAVGPPGLARPDFVGFRAPNLAQNQIEILDAQGKVLQGFPTNTHLQPDEMRMTVTILPAPQQGVGAPAQVRYYSLSRAKADVSFEFTDIPIP